MTASTCRLCSGVKFTNDVSSCTFCARFAASEGGTLAFVTVYFWCANMHPPNPPRATPSKNTNPTHRAALRVVDDSVIFISPVDLPGHRPPCPALPRYQRSIVECLALSTRLIGDSAVHRAARKTTWCPPTTAARKPTPVWTPTSRPPRSIPSALFDL